MQHHMNRVIICDHPLIKHKLSILRDQTISSNEFRKLMEELSMLIGYESMRNLKLKPINIKTPVSEIVTPVLAGKKPVIVPILRAGLGMADGVLKLLPTAKVGHIGISRDKKTLEAKEYFCKLPSSLEHRKIYAMDPMLATGGSAIEAIHSIKKRGGKDITFLCVVASPKGIHTLLAAHPDIQIVVGNLDPEINEYGFVSPGFGNAGDRYFDTE